MQEAQVAAGAMEAASTAQPSHPVLSWQQLFPVASEVWRAAMALGARFLVTPEGSCRSAIPIDFVKAGVYP